MKLLSLFLSFAFLLCCSTVHSAERPVHIFILSGQSNMAGMNPKLGFEPEAKKLFPDADVVYIKIAQGGQPIRYWVDQWNDIAEKHALEVKLTQPAKRNFYKQILQQYKNVLSKHPKPASVSFCWMQGERDAREKLSTAYSDALTQLIVNLRRDLEQSEMNCVIGRLSDFGKDNYTDWQNVRKAQVAVATQDTHGAWVDCDDLNDKEKNGVTRNDLHYTKEGYELLGRRYARQAKALIEGNKPAADGRPQE